MNFYFIIVLIFSIITTSSADEKLKSRITPFAESFASILGALSATGVASVVSPLILKLALLPLLALIKLMSKPIMIMGLTGYLMVALTPLILAKSGMATPVFTSRSQTNSWLPSLDNLMSTNLTVIAKETLNFFNVNNEECKMELTCKMGKKFADNHPYIYFFIVQSGAQNWIEDKYMANMVRSMTDSKECDNSCESLAIEDNSIRSTTDSTKLTTNTPSSPDTINEIIQWLGK